MVILGVDPGTARLGWGVVIDKKGNQTVGDYGCLQTAKSQSESARLAQLYQRFTKLLQKLKPDAVAVEDLFFFKNKKTVIKVSQARGVILLAVHQQKIKVFSYSPLQVKMAVTGYGRADKRQIQNLVKTILKLNTIPKPDDTADALAVALTHAFSHKMQNKIK